MFQMMAPINAAIIISNVTVEMVSNPAPKVSATATPNRNGPINSPTAVNLSATRGLRAREEITVATMLELSCNPFKKSKIRASVISRIRRGSKFVPVK